LPAQVAQGITQCMHRHVIALPLLFAAVGVPAAAPSRGTAPRDKRPASPCLARAIELTPQDVGSQAADVFTVLPGSAPARFGLGGGDVRAVNFDRTPDGHKIASEQRLTTEYATLGVLMNNIRVSDSVFQGPASMPNATWNNTPQIFTFTVPVVAVGIVNTSPDQNLVQLWSGPDATGVLLLEFRDQAKTYADSSIDRFVGGRACGDATIGSMKIVNSAGTDLELDELVFEVRAGQLRVAGR
jgi:hypothetical protein